MDRNRPGVRLPLQGAGGGNLTVRRLLLGSFLAVIGFLVGGQALITGRGLQEDLLSVQRRELRRELELVPLILRDLPAESTDSVARLLSRRTGYPVTLLDRDGMVVGASSELPFQLRGLVVPTADTELQAALGGDVGFSRRRGSGEVEIRLFAAAPITLGGDSLLLQVAAPLDGIRVAVRGRVRRTLLWALPALILALGLTHVLGRGLVRPVSILGRRARSLAAGNFARRVPVGGGVRELGELTGAFNRMTEELHGRFRSLEGERDEMQTLIDCMGEAVLALTEDARILRANQAAIDLLDFPKPINFAPVGTLVRQPELRSLLEGAVVAPFSAREVTLGDRNLLVSARATEGGGAVVTFVDVTELRRLEAVRRDFVANASHELKTPLTAMRGFAETLLEDELPEDLRREWLTSIRANTLRLQRLVDDLLDLSRLESGGWLARKDLVDVAALARDVLGQASPLAQDRGVSLEMRGEGLAVGDERGLEQVLRNLLENAIRYTPEGGEVFLEIVEDEGTVQVVVRDTGTGIPTAALSRIFERFYRVDPARSRAEGGTGLGLAIVRHLVHAMGGEVWAESELGHGTKIFFTLPGAEEGDEDEDDSLEMDQDGGDRPDTEEERLEGTGPEVEVNGSTQGDLEDGG
ncbi:MAG: ATP-binding protein [Longimicrobiales bacterium]